MEEQNFASGERKIEIRTLRYHSDQPLDRDLIPPDIMLANPSLAAGRSHAGGEDSNRRRLARAVRSEQTEDLSRRNLKREAVESNDLRLGRFVPLAARGTETQNRRRRREEALMYISCVNRGSECQPACRNPSMRLGIVVREIKPEGCDDCQFFAPFLIADEP